MGLFQRETDLKFPAEEVFEFHERENALKRLSPPWQKIKLVSHKGGIKPGARVKLFLYFPFKIPWIAKHIEYEKNHFFSDVQLFGPFKKWKHNHFFKELDSKSSRLSDKIEFKLPFYPLSKLFHPFVIKNLESTFFYRHLILKRDLEQNLKYIEKKKILISGASGILGELLIPRLTTAGHEVRTLVRKLPKNKNQFYWNPKKGLIDEKAFKDIDVVINLSGEPIGENWWTQKKKNRIVKSRIDTAGFLAKTISSLKNPPELFISSSATGFYGDTGSKITDENSPCGDLFISKVCSLWERAVTDNIDSSSNVRVVLLRTGVVLNPLGGALKIILRGFKTGTAGIVGNGKQYISWISSEDWINIVYETIFNKNIKGPVNAVSPNPVTFKKLMEEISKVTKFPLIFKIPGKLALIFTGQRGYETVICGTRALPEKLKDNNFRFHHQDLKSALREMLGRRKEE